MKTLKEVLIKNDWFAKQEVEELFTSEIIKCINEKDIRPQEEDIFNAFKDLTPEEVKVLIIGQDPYPDAREKEIADGLAFSSKNEDDCPDSLSKIFQEIKSEYKDRDCNFKSNSLKYWKKQGVLLLNSALTFKSKETQETHLNAWAPFITKVIHKILTSNDNPLVVILWGEDAKNVFFSKCIDINKNVRILSSSHPQARGETNTFKGCNHFKLCNEFLQENGAEIIEWWKTYKIEED